jgi:hypothetical protein
MNTSQSHCVSNVNRFRDAYFGARLKLLALALAALAGSFLTVHAGTLYVPNFSFELPVVPDTFPYATNELSEWEETAQPEDYNPTNNFGSPWSELVGTFYNVAFPGSFINNVNGVQAAFLSAYPGAGIFQDYDSIGGTNTVPDHAFNATFEAGKSYTLTVGLTGSTGEPLTQGTTIQLSLYYRDAASNMVTVASNTVTYDTNVFGDLTDLLDYQVQTPGVKATDPWAGQKIGIELLCTPSLALEGGFWDADNVRLTEAVYVPNYSFESPVVPDALPYATNELSEWEETPQPEDYNPTNNFGTPWSEFVGTFYNAPFPGSYISNLAGVQAAFLSAYPGAGIYQDYNSIGGTNTAPDHALNATFEVGKAYTLTVGLTGSTDEPLTPGTTIQLSLYYRDAASNIVTVAATNVTYLTNVFTNLALLTDFQVQLPGVTAADPWAGQNIGIELLCTPSLALAGGFWDADNVRLVDTVALNLINPLMTNGEAQFTVLSEPGLSCQILGTTNLSLPTANWTSLGTVNNVTGSMPFLDKQLGLEQRFYAARQLGVSKTGQ